MSVEVELIGGTNSRAYVSKSGVVATGPRDFSTASFNTLDVAGTAYNFWKPLTKQVFIITAIIAFADKDVLDSSDTVIEIYEADSADSTTVVKTLLQFGMGKLTVLPILPLNLKVTAGKWVNAKTGDDDIHMTIMGYYVEDL